MLSNVATVAIVATVATVAKWRGALENLRTRLAASFMHL